ncbi:MAG: glycosyltransferase family 4 protein [Chloroflexi bacterium]|nr:glycosyltransferase family 4 protein [Chloroflexota bacterium]
MRQYAAALCAGTPHRAYLKQLGMKPETIFTGYDVVDNEYFYEGAQRARVDPAAYHHLPGLNSPTPYFLASSRFIARKNLMRLLEAYYLYCDQSKQRDIPPWRLVLLGDGEERGTLENYVAHHGITGVTLAGFRQIEELPTYYGLARAFIHPALQDQWGLVVNEAMASGLPVFVSKQTGCAADLVYPNKNGFMFDAEEIEGLVEIMVYCTTNQNNLKNMGKNSRKIIQEWSLIHFAQNMCLAASAALTREK